MSNYTPIVSYGPKDSLSHGDPNKLIKGVQLDGEFNAISTAIATKIDSAFSNPSVQNINVTSSSIPTNGIYLPSANTVGTTTNGVQRTTINANGLFTVNAPTSGQGAIQANGAVFSFNGNTGSINSGVATTIKTIPSNSLLMYMVFATIANANDAPNYCCSAMVASNGTSSAKATTIMSAALLTITVSGMNIQVTQSSGGANVVTWYILQVV